MAESAAAVEVGVGTGRFAAPLGIKTGVEPAGAMAELARLRGIDVIRGVAERLPLEDASFDLVMMITTICFLDNVSAAFSEAHRVLMAGGHLLVGFLDRGSELGKHYDEKKAGNVFYTAATFRSSEEVLNHLKKAGFRDPAFVQTIFESPGGMTEVAPVRSGWGEGLFVVARGRKPSAA